MTHSIRLWLETQGLNPGRVGCLSPRLCLYSAPNCSKAMSVQCFLW